jgi:hypothetical protein
MLDVIGNIAAIAQLPPAAPGFIEIGTPRPSQDESRSFRAVGTSDVFEAAMRFRIRDAAGHLVRSGTIQASSGSGTPGTWERNFRLPDSARAGDYTLRVFSMDMDGSGVAESDKVSFHVPRVGVSGAGFDPGFIDVAPATATGRHGRTEAIVGSANTFEGAMEYRVWHDGHVVKHGTIQASSGSGTAGTFQKTVKLPDSAEKGLYTVSVFERSAENGKITTRDKVDFAVR